MNGDPENRMFNTLKCSHSSAKRFGLNISIVDIFDIVDTSQNKEDIKNEISKCVKTVWSHDDPNAIILVLKKGRYTEDERKFVQYLVDIFGEKIIQYVIVISPTKLRPNEGKDLNHTESGISTLSTLLRKCEGRVMEFKDKSKKDLKVKELLQMIIKNVDKNNSDAN